MKFKTLLYNYPRRLKKRNSLYSLMNWSLYGNAVKKISTIIFFINIVSSYSLLQAQRLSRDYEVSLLTNQIGYRPSSTKTCLMMGTKKTAFEIIKATSNEVTYRGTLITGGWHDASDLRKWVSATIYGVMGLARAYNLEAPQYRKAILAELLWGNQYFLKMQEPQGYVMDFIGGDLKKHSDNNRWTNNEVESGSTDIKLITPNAGTSTQPMLASGNVDDRIIQTQPVEMSAQYNFITAEAMMARITLKTDTAYSKRCLKAAKKCYDWCRKQGEDSITINTGAALQAAIEMFTATARQVYYKQATELALHLKKLQATDTSKGLSGFFYNSFSNHNLIKISGMAARL